MDSQDGIIGLLVANCFTCHAVVSEFALRSGAKGSCALHSIVSVWPPSELAQNVLGDAYSTCVLFSYINKRQTLHISDDGYEQTEEPR